jgi:hypothetical protein
VNTPAVRRAAGLLLIIVPLAFTVCFTLLQQLFEYPDILRQPTAEVLAKFAAGGTPLIAVWYALTLTAVAFVPVTLLVHRVLAERNTPMLLWLATAFGLIAGLSQTLSFLRWPFLVPHLAQAYLAPGASEAQRAAAGMVFEAFHRYAGMAVGEHLGYLFTGIWSVTIGIGIAQGTALPAWLGWAGVAIGAGLAIGSAEFLGPNEQRGWRLAGSAVPLLYVAWSLWLLAVGIALIA